MTLKLAAEYCKSAGEEHSGTDDWDGVEVAEATGRLELGAAFYLLFSRTAEGGGFALLSQLSSYNISRAGRTAAFFVGGCYVKFGEFLICFYRKQCETKVK